MLYLIGLGLNLDGISTFGLEVVKKCKRVYLENYTVDLPYSVGELQDFIGKKVILADREFIEGLSLVDEAAKLDVALLVYGSPLFATTHIALLQEARASGVKYKVIYNASVFDAVAETGLQLYKFGKTASMPNFEADSYVDIIKQNLSTSSHSLILIDIGMDFPDALAKLHKDTDKYKVKLEKIIVCSRLGTARFKVYYDTVENLKQLNVLIPFCFVVPSKLHFMEKEVLESFANM